MKAAPITKKPSFPLMKQGDIQNIYHLQMPRWLFTDPRYIGLSLEAIGSRRQAVISGKYGGGVFCTLSDETVCLCHYSTLHSDLDFHVGDTVILAIKQFDYERSLIYGRILSKW